MSYTAYIHTVAGFLALGFGFSVVLGRKGTRTHRRLGHGYFVSMLVLSTTAFPMVTGEGFSVFYVLAFNALALTLVGYGGVLLRRHLRHWYYWHYHGMYWSFTGLMGATANEIVVHVPSVNAWFDSLGMLMPILVLQGLIMSLAAILIFRHQNPTLREMGFIN